MQSGNIMPYRRAAAGKAPRFGQDVADPLGRQNIGDPLVRGHNGQPLIRQRRPARTTRRAAGAAFHRTAPARSRACSRRL
jgi:hypothetical protein